MAQTQTPTQVTTGKVRLSYANIFEPKSIDGGKSKYSVSIIIDKEDKETIAKIEKAIKAAFDAGISKLGLKAGAAMPKNFKTPLRDGDEDRPNDEAYVGKLFLNCSTDKKPIVCDLSRQVITDPLAVVSGDYARVSLNFYAFNTNGNKGIAAGLGAVQFVKKGEPLGSSVNIDVAFGDDFEIEDEDDL